MKKHYKRKNKDRKAKNNIESTNATTTETLESEARQEFEKVLTFSRQSELTFWENEKQLFVLMAALGRLLLRLFLAARHERLDLQPNLADGVFERGKQYAERTIQTAYGPVCYGRSHLRRRAGGAGLYPLDVVLGLTRDSLSPRVMQLLGRLATRMSFQATRLVAQTLLCWAPSHRTVEDLVLGLGRQAAPFMEQLAAPAGDGEVLVIEIDGKCPPMVSAAEMAKRRGKRHQNKCTCGCQRHRGQGKRQARGSRKRREKGGGKNGKEAIVVVMYTLKRGADGKLHGPVNKKVWASLAGRNAMAKWARAEATKRGFPTDTTKTVQIVLDGAKSLKSNMEPLFPGAIFTLDVCHVVERLWKLGRVYHKKGSDELRAWVADLKKLVYAGKPAKLVERLRGYLQEVSRNGPGTKNRRQTLCSLIGYLEPRLDMMRYAEWREQDLVIASGQVEGAVRHAVGERLDCSGMRWLPGKAEPLLQLRCIELNGDWDKFFAWTQTQYHEKLLNRERVKILTDQPMKVVKAA